MLLLFSGQKEARDETCSPREENAAIQNAGGPEGNTVISQHFHHLTLHTYPVPLVMTSYRFEMSLRRIMQLGYTEVLMMPP